MAFALKAMLELFFFFFFAKSDSYSRYADSVLSKYSALVVF